MLGILLVGRFRVMAFAAIATANTNTRNTIFLHLSLRVANDLFGFRDLAGNTGWVAFDTNGEAGFLGCALQGLPVETHDHAGEVIGAEAGEGMFDKLLGGDAGVGYVAD